MNILVITQMYSQPDDVGDNKPTKTVNYFVKEWIAMGHSVVVMHCPSKFPIALYLLPRFVKEKFAGKISTMVPSIESRKRLCRDEKGAKVYRIPMMKFIPGQAYSEATMKNQTKVIVSILKKINFIPDLILGHFANPSLELVANVSERYDAKSSIVFHHDCNGFNIKKYRIMENIERIGAIGARSIIEANQIKEDLHLEKLPFVCYSGVPNDAVQVVEKTCQKQNFDDGIKYLYVGSLIKRKHIDVVVKAFLKIANPKDTLEVIGGGPEEGLLKKLVDGSNANGNIIFTGRISRNNVLKHMKKSQIFTLISDGETYGMVYIEAMLQGCLTIASKGQGFDGIIVDGVNGFICNPGDEEDLVSIYKRISAMTEHERNTIAQAAINTAIHYSEREVAGRYLDEALRNQK